MFNQGDLDYVDNALAPDAVDHQEPDGTDVAVQTHSRSPANSAHQPDLRVGVPA
jgi:hypothetical protein